MQAVIAESGKQFFVKAGDRVQLDYRELEPGAALVFDRVLMVTDGNGKVAVGAPYLPNATVTAKALGIVRGKKLHVGFYRKRKNFRKHKGHRQSYLEVQIEAVAYG